MEFKSYQDILAVRNKEGRVFGFHARNLQVAELDPAVWKALSGEESPEVFEELTAWQNEVDANAQDATTAQGVRHLLVNVAQVCNLKCVYCAAGGDGTFGEAIKHIEIETIYDQLRGLLHDVPKGETFTLTFFGGEPLLNPKGIQQIARFAKLQVAGRGINLRFHTITNGTLVTPEIAELLASINCHVTVSIDGPPDVNNIARPTRGGRGSTAMTLKGLANLIAVRPRLGSLGIGSVFGKHYTDVEATYAFLEPYKFDSMKFDFAAEGADEAASQAFADSLARTADRAYQIGGETELRRISSFDAYFRNLDEQVRINNHCGAGKSLLASDGKGRLAACQWFMGRPQDEVGQGAKLDHAKLAAYAGDLNKMNNCQSCWARFMCGGGCMFVNEVKSGSRHKKDSAFCNRMRHTLGKVIEYYAEARSGKQNEGVSSEVH